MSDNTTTQSTSTSLQQTEQDRDLENIPDLSDKDNIGDTINKFLDAILEESEKDETEEIVKDYLDSAGSLGLHDYSFRNQYLLFIQMQSRGVEYKDNAQFFNGFKGWKDHGRHVMSGETGYKVIAPYTGTKCPECGNTPSYHKNEWIDCSKAGTKPSEWDFDPQEEWDTGVIYFKPVTTFAYEQTDVLDDADPDEVFEAVDEDNAFTEENDIEELFDILVGAAEDGKFEVADEDHETIEVTIDGARSPLEVRASGWSSGGEIYLKEQENTAEMFKTLVHEISHEINDSSIEGRNTPKPVKEVSAEATAYIVCSYFGIKNTQSELYIATWVKNAEEIAEEETDDWDEEDEDEEEFKKKTARSVIESRFDGVQDTSAEIIRTIEAERGNPLPE